MKELDLVAPLTSGLSVVEASAGTGKTYSIASLFARLVAEDGVKVDQILVVTFTRAAARELHERIRRRLLELARALRRAPKEEDDGDRVLAHLRAASVGASAKDRYVARLEDAVRSFDEAQVSTIHSFCQRVLVAHAVERGGPLDLGEPATGVQFHGVAVDRVAARWLVGRTLTEASVLVHAVGANAKDGEALLKLAMAQPSAVLLPAPDGEAPTTLRAWSLEVDALRDEWPPVREALAHGVHQRRASERKFKGTQAFGWLRRWDAFFELPDPSVLVALWARFPPGVDVQQAGDGARSFGQRVDGLVALGTSWVDRLRAQFATELRDELRALLEDGRAPSYDQLVFALWKVLSDEDRGESLARGLRARYRAVLLDEFQDTDRLQWEIFRRAFTEHSGPIVYLIGDPKQSIYRFRGADVDVYVQARATAPAERQTTMAVNHRSDGPYVEALNALFDGEPDAFGASGVHYVPVRAAARHATPRIEGHGPAALSLRWLDGDGLEGLGAGQPLDRALSEVAARDIVALVSSGARLRRGLEVEPLRYRDIAVIVRTNAQGLLVRDALTQKGVSALMQERGNVLAGPEGELCAVVLGAIAEPGDERRCLGLAVAPGFEPPGLGSSGKAALLAGDGAGDGWSEFRRAIYGWSATYERMGCFAALFQALTEGNVWNLLAAGRGGGDRVDGMRQVVEILNEAAHGRSLGPSELLQWVLREQEADDESYRRRASSDTESVRIATIHASKGLEYPFVFLPFAGLPAAMQKGRERPLTHDADGNLELFLGDLASDEGKRRLVASQRESAADGMRQLYVALTRAQHAARVYLPFVDPKSRVEKAVEAYASSSLGALLHGVDREESVDGAPSRMEVARARLTDGGFARARKDVEALCRRCGVEGAIAAEAWHAHPDEVLHGTAAVAPGTEPFACSELAARPVPAGRFSVTWRRVSYTSITSVGGSEEPLRGMDEGATDAALPTGEDGADDRAPPRRSERVPLADVRGGAGFGLFVHTLLEHVDFGTLRPRTTATPDVAPPLSEVARGFAERHGVDDERVCARTVEALASWVRAPLGGTLGERSLSTFEPRDRLDELRFDLSVAGDGPPIEFRALADAMSIGAADDSYPFGAATDGAAYISRLRQLSQERFRGFLTGAIDLVLRVRTPETSRFVLIDYKTNRLLDARGECTWAAYDGASLGRAMIHHDYVLQYHLYLVALHRYLGARMPHYAYEEHIEGVRYLFVRGLGGPAAAGSLHGVFIDRPPEARIRALDALLGGGAPARRPPSVTGGTP